MAIERLTEKVMETYQSTISSLDEVLIGQKNVKKVIASSILCDSNSKILLTGNTGTGKTTLSKFLGSSFCLERISVTSDMIPSDIQEQLRNKPRMNFLQIDEFNRASGKVQSAFIELFAEKQMSIGGVQYKFDDFYVFATQNSADISGIFNVPQAVYDRFDVNVYFDDLTEEEKRFLLFSEFEPATMSSLSLEELKLCKIAVSKFQSGKSKGEIKKDEDVMMKAFEIIDSMTMKEKKMFAGSNIRAHKFALKLAKINALANGRNYLLSADIADFVNYLYMHRIDQNIARIGDYEVEERFYDVKQQILSIKRRKF